MTRNEIAQGVIAYAEAHYEDGGWDVIVECHDEASIIELLKDDGKAFPKDTFQAVGRLRRGVVSVWAERQADAKISAF